MTGVLPLPNMASFHSSELYSPPPSWRALYVTWSNYTQQSQQISHTLVGTLTLVCNEIFRHYNAALWWQLWSNSTLRNCSTICLHRGGGHCRAALSSVGCVCELSSVDTVGLSRAKLSWTNRFILHRRSSAELMTSAGHCSDVTLYARLVCIKLVACSVVCYWSLSEPLAVTLTQCLLLSLATLSICQ